MEFLQNAKESMSVLEIAPGLLKSGDVDLRVGKFGCRSRSRLDFLERILIRRAKSVKQLAVSGKIARVLKIDLVNGLSCAVKKLKALALSVRR